MKKAFVILISLIAGLLILTACSPTPEPTATPTSSAPIVTAGGDHLVISEVLAGADGNNTYDFIELYNPTTTAIDLKGYALWHVLNEGDKESLVYVWDQNTLIPPQGHYLLGQETQDFGLASDALISYPLVPNRGGLILRDPERETADSLGWGDAPPDTVEGQAAPAMENGVSLERAPGGVDGNSTDTDNNATDFALNTSPTPQNTGSPVTPALDGELTFNVIPPESVSPGETFEITLQLENLTGETLNTLNAVVTLPDDLSIDAVGENLTLDGQTVTWQLDSLEASASASAAITATAPWTYLTLNTHSYYVEAANWPLAVFGPPVVTEVTGGSIPILTARELVGQEVVIEGTATMYVGGFYAGSGAKFYIEDETGGAQIYVAGAGSTLVVEIGDRVRVQGVVTLYRDSIEIIPASESKVEILAQDTEEVAPQAVSIGEAAHNETTLPGALVQVEGNLSRVEEFSYSYELDMVDTDGQLLTVYVDKETGMTIATVESGQRYKITGIMEMLDGYLRLYPRGQADLQQVYPEILMVTVETPVSVSTGEPFDILLHVFNHTTESVSQIEVRLPLPAGLLVSDIGQDGVVEDGVVTWTIPQIAGDGASETVSLQANIAAGTDYITLADYQISAPGYEEPILGDPTYVFAGGSVPIWAIQGSGFNSPYVNAYVETEGVVTGVFPDLDGFWIQDGVDDGDPATSPGLFVYTPLFSPEIASGDVVAVKGIVQEYYQQTELLVTSPINLEVLQSNVSLPAPIALDPPADEAESLAYYEALEGALVTVNQDAIVVDSTDYYGEFAFVLAKDGRERLFQGEDNGIIIIADDGSSMTHEDQSTLPYAVSTGDTVRNLTGPLSYTFNNYKIETLAAPTIIPGGRSYDPLPNLEEGQFSLMTWNVENLFDIVDPHPSSPPLPTVSEYRQQIEKVAATIVTAGAPTIIGLQEVENIGILEDIAEHELVADYGYIPVLIEGDDSRGIDVGYLVRGDMAEVMDVVQYPAPEGITSRPPLLVKVQIKDSDTVVYVLNNHFTSMSGGEAATEPRRNAQAAWNVEVMDELLTADPGAALAVIGDLNSYYSSLPIQTLRDGGLVHAFDRLPAEERYTYIYEGVSQTLDHIMMTPELDSLVSDVTVLHVNADFPISAADDVSPLHKSDHDPVIVVFDLP
ncbi:lamin tail domain-containing protein [bacterium]|nr:lamin tail domain-containing protein [bacterium]MCB2179128.1 lamin tail domain-containing protein [bacterium]